VHARYLATVAIAACAPNATTIEAKWYPEGMKIPTLIGAATLVLTAAACDANPAKGKAQATAAEPLAASAAPASAVKYTFSNANSKIDFVGAKVTRKHEGSFQSFTGTVSLVDGNPEKSSVSTEIDVASLKADEEKLTGHLKTPDLLDVAKYPKATFASTSIKTGGEKGATHTVTGNMQLHGVTKSIVFPATVKIATDAVDVDSEFAINRKDFGVVYPGMPDDLIKDEVLLKLHIHATKPAEQHSNR
jgi:polyisoprenoid-binding protein YceI